MRFPPKLAAGDILHQPSQAKAPGQQSPTGQRIWLVSREHAAHGGDRQTD
jgi:hypothetical protein